MLTKSSKPIIKRYLEVTGWCWESKNQRGWTKGRIPMHWSRFGQNLQRKRWMMVRGELKKWWPTCRSSAGLRTAANVVGGIEEAELSSNLRGSFAAGESIFADKLTFMPFDRFGVKSYIIHFSNKFLKTPTNSDLIFQSSVENLSIRRGFVGRRNCGRWRKRQHCLMFACWNKEVIDALATFIKLFQEVVIHTFI